MIDDEGDEILPLFADPIIEKYMKEIRFLFANIAILPFILIIGGFSNISIALFWVSSLILGISFIRPIIKKCGVLQFLSPCMLTYFYCIVNYVTGSIYYCTDFLSSTVFYEQFFKIEHTHLLFILVFLNFCNSIVAVIGIKYPLYFSTSRVLPKEPFKVFSIFILLSLFVLLHIFIFDLSVIGGSAKGSQITQTGTEMNYPFILGIVILIVHKINIYRTPVILHIVLIGVIVYVMAVDSVGSKRELFFIIIAVLIVELIFHDWRIRLTMRNILISCIIAFSFIYYILSASIVRGYGGFGVEKLSDAVSLVSEYAENENFQEVVGNNFETPYHYATAVISCEYSITGKIPILFGETFIRVLFIPVPRSIYKPRKMIDVFTIACDKQKREEGVSLPTSAYAELFANFHLLSIIFLYILYRAFQKLYNKMVCMGRSGNYSYLYLVTAFALSLQFIRGSGFESLVIYSLLAGSSIYLGKLLLRLFESHTNMVQCDDKLKEDSI